MPSVAQEENTEENDFDRIGRELDKLEAVKRVESRAAEENLVEPHAEEKVWLSYVIAFSYCTLLSLTRHPYCLRLTNLPCQTRVPLLLLLLLKMEVVIRIWR